MDDDLKRFEATPTEYRGVVFRSKSEAILARNFDLLDLFWNYEPVHFLQEDLWRPDFWIILPKKSPNPGFRSLVVEYKPKEPTDTYRKRLWQRFSTLQSYTPSDCLLICGTAYDSLEPKFIDEWNIVDWTRWPNTSLINAITDAMRYRFDLKEAA